MARNHGAGLITIPGLPMSVGVKRSSAPAVSYGPELLAAPADISSVSWTKTNVTVTANNAADSNSTAASADTVLETTTTGAHRFHQSAGTREPGARYRAMVVIKPVTRNVFNWELSDNATGALAAQFNLGVPDATDTSYGGTWGAGTFAVTAIGNGFYRCSMEADSPGSGADWLLPLIFVNGAFASSYAGDTTAGFIIESVSLKKVL